MTMQIDSKAQEIMSRVWPQYTAAIPRSGEPVDVYRAERDAYVKEVNTSDAVVQSIELISVPGPAGPIPLRIYRPLGDRADPLPIVLYLHGGGWTVGGGDALDGSYRAYCAAVGALLVTPDYRLAPEHKFPAAVEDCWAVAQWLPQHAADIGGDPNRIAVTGESSGGNLAAVLSDMSRGDPNVQFRVQVLVYPALDLVASTASYMNTHDTFTRDKMRWYIDCYVRNEEDKLNPKASPVYAKDFAGLPKTVLVTGGADPLLDEADVYAAHLRHADVAVECLKLEGWPHGFAFWPETEAYERMMDVAAGALRRALGLE